MNEQTASSAAEPNPITGWLRDIFSIDTRSLAALRIGLGLIIAWEALANFIWLRWYFTEEGPTPSSVFAYGIMKWQSVYFASTNVAWTYSMFAAQAILGLLLMLGWRTRIVTVGCFVMIWSQINRNNLIAHGGHNMLVWYLIWSIFLPLGARASVDSRTRAAVPPAKVFSAATIGVLMQLIFTYGVACAVKFNPQWTSEFSAVHGFLRSHLGTPLGLLLTQIPPLTMFLTVATLMLEAMGPALALLTGRTPWLRMGIVSCFLIFHLGLVTCLYIGSFGWICMVAWIVYFPGPVWDFLGRFSILRAVREVWNGLTTVAAGIIGKIPGLPVRTAVRGPGWGQTILVSLIVVFVSAVNLRNMFPSVIGRLFPGAFPNLKQSWGVMDIPWQQRVRLLVEATCADGSTVMLVAPSPHQIAPRWNDYLWPPEHSRLLAMQNRLMGRVMTIPQDRPPMELFCAGHRRRWDETHPPEKRIVSLRAIRESRNISPVAVASAEDGPPRRLTLYEWQTTADGAGKSTFIQLR